MPLGREGLSTYPEVQAILSRSWERVRFGIGEACNRHSTALSRKQLARRGEHVAQGVLLMEGTGTGR